MSIQLVAELFQDLAIILLAVANLVCNRRIRELQNMVGELSADVHRLRESSGGAVPHETSTGLEDRDSPAQPFNLPSVGVKHTPHMLNGPVRVHHPLEHATDEINRMLEHSNEFTLRRLKLSYALGLALMTLGARIALAGVRFINHRLARLDGHRQ
ncbi:hypothetical protein DSM100688_0422 [Bifidobacterium ramosum]|uniref:Uncharacterized protein n=1 Tax=Bifidobacterium ramosum TaxID=1798158 RepID=A0A6L4X3R8_9BIFI|nr:hypothetical protein [Bifidobacterium ramosum]KAB8289342.1 hypothetical protein DSM100688_0422 [Bifidobacterium ramosum]NEG71040.1 hypothetical protein [Bifidobacterium ramosum]